MIFKVFRQRACILLLAILIVACGGSGGGDSNEGAARNPAPTITVLGEDLISIDQGSTYTDMGATALDSLEQDIEVTVTGEVDTSVAGTYVLTYTTIDGSGNTSTATRTINVIDTISPVISLIGSESISIDQFSAYSENSATAKDGETDIEVVITGEVDASISGVYTITYTAADSADNSSSVSRTITVVDNTPPLIMLTGDSTVRVLQYATYSELGATAKDGETNVDVVRTGSVDTSIAGSYTVTYTATDSAGNSADTSRTVNVVDETPPVLILLGESEVEIAQGGVYNELGATAKDGEVDVEVFITGAVDVGIAGVYEITYTATDVAGNSISAARVVNVVDRTPPIVTMNGESSIKALQNVTYVELGATAKDGEVDVEVAITGFVDTKVVGDYFITYTAIDVAGNTASTIRTISVISGQVSKTFTYDVFGRVVNEDFGNGRSINYTYDDNGNLINQTVVGGE